MKTGIGNGCLLTIGKALLGIILLVPLPSMAQQFDMANFREMVTCGKAFMSGHSSQEVSKALVSSGVGVEYRQKLLDSISPLSPIRQKIEQFDAKTTNGASEIVYLNGQEAIRTQWLVDKTHTNVATWVLAYYMAAAAGIQCNVAADVKDWMDGLAYEKLQRFDDVVGQPFVLLDYQQAMAGVCAYEARGSKTEEAPVVARWIIANGKLAGFEAAARAALVGSSHLAEVDASWQVPIDLTPSLGLKSRQEAVAVGTMSAVYAAGIDDPNFATRMKARLVYTYYLTRAAGGGCEFPPESLTVIESLHDTSN